MFVNQFTPAIERWVAKVGFTDGCWLWNAVKTHNGYGKFAVNRKQLLAHRWAYEFFVGPIPTGLTIDHLCRVRHCVNPDHLEPIPHRDNILRGTGFSAMYARQTHCVNGHPFDEVNTRISIDSKGRRARVCRTCVAAAQRRYQARLAVR